MSEADKILSQLPAEAQESFLSCWNESLFQAVSRHGSFPDPDQREAVEDLIKLFFVRGYSVALADEKRRNRELRTAIEAKFAEFQRAK